MKRILSLLLAAVLVLSLLPAAFAAAPGEELTEEQKRQAFYTVGPEVNTFAGLCESMCRELDLREHPLPAAAARGDEYDTGEYEVGCVLKDDRESYCFIGYVYSRKDVAQYIVWRWIGFHKDGALIGLDAYFDLDGRYLGNIRRDYAEGTSASSAGCPYSISGDPIDRE